MGVVCVAGDVSIETDVEKVIERAVAEFGGVDVVSRSRFRDAGSCI